MSEKQKVLILIVMTAVLLALLVQSALDGECMKYHADGAQWTAAGVYCWRDRDIFREYYQLSELRKKHEGPPVDLIIKPTPSPMGEGL